MRAIDQYHVGIVVPDVDAEIVRLSSLFGHEWTDELAVTLDVEFPTVRRPIELVVRYSRTAPHLELIRAVPGTFWMPVAASTLHHLGFWSDDLEADGAELEAAGYSWDAVGYDPTGMAQWSYWSCPERPRIELVTRAVQPFMEALFAG
jgi:hypothetical protein